MKAILLHVPPRIKAKLDALREQGTTTNGFIRALLEREFRHGPRTKRTAASRRSGGRP